MIKFRALFSFNQKEVKRAFSHAKKKASIPGLKLLKSIAEGKYGKLLIVIPKKAGNAYERNKLKRQIKAIFYQEKLYEKATLHIIIVYKDAQELGFDGIKSFLVQKITQGEK